LVKKLPLQNDVHFAAAVLFFALRLRAEAAGAGIVALDDRAGRTAFGAFAAGLTLVVVDGGEVARDGDRAGLAALFALVAGDAARRADSCA
jgi:hypothetical protein